MPTAPSNPAIDDEEDDLTPLPPAVQPRARTVIAPPSNTGVHTAPKPAEIGSTGGMVPTQGELGGAQPAAPTAYSQDPAERQRQARQVVDENFRKQQQASRPFAPSGSLAQPGSLPEGFYRAGENMADEAAMNDRRAEVQRRRQANADATLQRKTKNAELEAEMRGTGQKFYTDAFGNIQPVIEAGTKRPLYEQTNWEDGGVHPETGEPTLVKRDQYGQRQYKQPALTVGADPTDDQLYYKFGDDDLRPAGSMIELTKHANPKIARMALGANKRRIEATHREALAGVKAIADGASLELESAKENVAQAQGRIEELMTQAAAIPAEMLNETAGGLMGIGASPTPGALAAQQQKAQLEAEAMRLNAEMETMKADIKPGGRLARAKAMSAVGMKIATATAVRDTFAAQEAVILARLNDEGGTPEKDPLYLQNKRNLDNAAAVLQQATREQDRFNQVFNQQAPAAAPVSPDQEVSTVGGVINTAARAGRQSMAALNVLGAGNRLAKRDEYLASAARAEQQAATLPPGRLRDATLQTVERLRARAAAMGESAGGELTAAGEQIKKAGALKGTKVYEDYSQAKGADALMQFLANPIEIATNIAGEGAAGSIPTIAAGVAGAAVAGPAGLAAGTGIGSFATEYASTLLEVMGDAGIDPNDAAGMAAGFSDPAIMEQVKTRGLARGIPIAAFDALSGGLAGRVVGPTVKAGAKNFVKTGLAAGREVLEQGALGGAGELGAQVSEQLATTGDVTDISVKDIAAEMIGEAVPGLGQVVIGGAMRAAKPGVSPQEGGGNPMVPPGGALPPANDTGIPGSDTPAPPITGAPLTPDQQAADELLQQRLRDEPKSAADSARVFEPAAFSDTDAAPADERSVLIRDRDSSENVEVPVRREEPPAGEPGHAKGLPPANAAAESALTFRDEASERRALATSEEGAQALVDELQEVTGRKREDILATRAGKDVGAWAEELQSEIEYRRSPLTVDPDRRSTELRGELAKLDREWEAHVTRTAIEAERAAQRAARGPSAGQVNEAETAAARDRHELLTARREAIEMGLQELERSRKSPASAEGLRGELETESQTAAAAARRLRTPELEARRDAIEDQLTDAERLRQSDRGAELLADELVQEEARTTSNEGKTQVPPPDADGPGPASAVPTGPDTPTAPQGASPAAPAEIAVEFDDTPSPAPQTAATDTITPSPAGVPAAPADIAKTTPRDVSNMNPAGFMDFYSRVNKAGAERSLTGDAHAFGAEHTTPAQIEDLKQLRDTARELTRIAMEKGDENAMGLAYKSQYFAEAYDIASKTGTYDTVRDVAAKIEKATAPQAAAPKVGDLVKLKVPGPNGAMNVAGTVKHITPDGRLEVKTQNHGYTTVNAADVEIAAQLKSGTPFVPPPEQGDAAPAAKATKGPITLRKMGDFYEAYGDEAKAMAKELNITLTRRQERPMAGIPFHALDRWVKQLQDAGYAVTVDDKSKATAEELRNKIAFLETARKSEAAKPRKTSAIQQRQIGINNDYLKKIDALKAELAALDKPAAAPAEDGLFLGTNAAGERLYELKDKSVYRLRDGKRDFGGDLAPAAPKPAADDFTTVKQGDVVTVKMPDGRKYPQTRVTKIVDTPEGRRYQVDVFGEKFVKRDQIETKAELEAADKRFDKRVEASHEMAELAKMSRSEMIAELHGKGVTETFTGGYVKNLNAGELRAMVMQERKKPASKPAAEESRPIHRERDRPKGMTIKAWSDLVELANLSGVPFETGAYLEALHNVVGGRERIKTIADGRQEDWMNLLWDLERKRPDLARQLKERSEERAAAAPVVKKETAAGPVIASTPATDQAVSKMADRAQLKAQKDFLVKALADAEKAAPEELPMTEKGVDRMAEVDAVAFAAADPDATKRAKGKADLQALGRKAGLDKYELAKTDEQIADTLRYHITRDSGQHVTIEVPGDGTFRVPNVKYALKAFAKQVNTRMNKTTADLPSPFSDEVKPYVAPKPTAIPSIKKNPTKEDLTAAAAIAQSKDESRIVINRVYSDDGFSIGTDGRRLFIVAGGGGETAADVAKIQIEEKDVKGKVTGTKPAQYPNWRQVTPGWLKVKDGKIRAGTDAPAKRAIVDTSDAIKALNQVIAVTENPKDKQQVTRMYVLEGGKLGFSAFNPDLGDYRSDGVTDAMIYSEDQAATAADPEFLRDAFTAARLAGHERVTLYIGDAREPMTAIGGNNFAAITMPVGMEGPGTAMSKPAPVPVPKPSGIAYQPGYGPGGKTPTQAEKNRAAFEADKARRGPQASGTAAQQDPTPPTPAELEGDKINRAWTAYGPESKSLGIPRAEMPQIKSEHRGALAQFLAARGVKTKPAMVDPATLRPTQAEFSPAKVQKAREYEGSERPILISADGHVVDGHHQWMAALDEKGTPIPVIRLEAPIDKVLAEMKEFPSMETAAGAAPAAKPTPAPAATKTLGERALNALEETLAKKKKDIQGKVFSAPEGLYRAAEIAGLEVAVLAVRAGRALAEAASLAAKRFTAKYPKHTPEELANFNAAIRRMLDERPPTPPPDDNSTRKNSLFPESAKAAGAPAKSIQYDTRGHEARRDEAAAILRREGREAGERLLRDSNIPGDTRVAIGGNLIAGKMLELANAGAGDVQKVTKDIRRIVAIMQPELATEAGQQISMFGGIYKDIRVAAGVEYLRNADKETSDALGGPDATAAVDDAIAAVKGKEKVAAEKALEALKKKHSTKPATKVIDAFKRKIDKVLELDRIGALDREDMADIAAAELGVKAGDPKKLKHIADIAEKIHGAKSHAERSRHELELADTLSIYKGISRMDVLSSLLTANVLSGYTTQLANIEGNFLQGFAQLATTAAVNPRNVGAIVKGLMHGAPIGGQEALSILRTGRATRDFQDKTGGAGSTLQTVDFKREFGVPGAAGDALTLGARAVEKVFRFMKAADAVFYYPAREAYARLVTTKLLEGEYSGAELARKVDETLHITPEAFAAAKAQAVADGYTGIDLARRTADIIEENRRATDAGNAAVTQSEQFAAESTFTNEPVGLAGVAYHALKYAVEEGRLAKVPILKPWLMFLKTPTNVFNAIGNWTPVGAMRAFHGMRGAGMRKPDRKNFTSDERKRLYLQSAIGSAVMIGLMSGLIDDDKLDITATGPTDGGKRRQLQSAGWSPYSFKIGDRRISYKDSPLLIPLALMGHMADVTRYQKSKSDLIFGSKKLDSALRAPQVIFETSMLTGLGELMAAARDGDMRGVTRTLSSLPANLVIPYNRLLQQIDQTFDSQSYQSPPVVGSVPGVRRTGKALTDVQGRPATYNPSRRFTTVENNDPVDTVLRSKNVFIPEVGKDVKLGNGIMDDDTRDKYRTISGARIRARLLIAAPRLKTMTQEKAQDEISRIAAEEREKVKAALRFSATRQTPARN